MFVTKLGDGKTRTPGLLLSVLGSGTHKRLFVCLRCDDTLRLSPDSGRTPVVSPVIGPSARRFYRLDSELFGRFDEWGFLSNKTDLVGRSPFSEVPKVTILPSQMSEGRGLWECERGVGLGT